MYLHLNVQISETDWPAAAGKEFWLLNQGMDVQATVSDEDPDLYSMSLVINAIHYGPWLREYMDQPRLPLGQWREPISVYASLLSWRCVPVTRADWKVITPTAGQQTWHPAEIPLTQEEMACLRMGRCSSEMEDKWVMFMENDHLYCVRSWTGIVAFQAETEKTDSGFRIHRLGIHSDFSGDPGEAFRTLHHLIRYQYEQFQAWIPRT